MLLGLPLIWAFQPFTAFVLGGGIRCGLAAGARPVACRGRWLLWRRSRPCSEALVYAYELFGSIKEVTALGMILALGALVRGPGSGGCAPPWGVIPFALIVAGGVSALGAAFGVWALMSALALLPAIVAALRDGGGARGRALVMLVVGVLVVLLAALPVWTSAGGSVQVAEGIASTTNPGNLVHALPAIQLFGIWLAGGSKLEPTGAFLGPDPRARAAGAGGRPARRVAAVAPALPGAVGLVRADAARLPDRGRVGLGVGRGQDADAELTRRRAARVGRSGGADRPAGRGPWRWRARGRSAWP